MDIVSEKERCIKAIADLENQLKDISFKLKHEKAKLRKWESLEEKAKEIANQ